MPSLIFLIVALCATLFAQETQFEYGKANEMRDVTRFFLDTQGNMKRRGQIIELLKKKLPGLSFADRAEDAEALIIYTEEQSIRFAGGTSVNDLSCNAYVAIPLAKSKARLLFSYTTKKKNIFQHDPYKNFADAFVKAYKEANAAFSKNP